MQFSVVFGKMLQLFQKGKTKLQQLPRVFRPNKRKEPAFRFLRDYSCLKI